MNIEDMTIGQAQKLAAMFGNNTSDSFATWQIGKNYLIRTVTHIQTGRLVAVTDHEIVLEDAAWIADTGRFQDALDACSFVEVEMFPKEQIIVGRGALIDATPIKSLPTEQK